MKQYGLQIEGVKDEGSCLSALQPFQGYAGDTAIEETGKLDNLIPETLQLLRQWTTVKRYKIYRPEGDTFMSMLGRVRCLWITTLLLLLLI